METITKITKDIVEKYNVLKTESTSDDNNYKVFIFSIKSEYLSFSDCDMYYIGFTKKEKIPHAKGNANKLFKKVISECKWNNMEEITLIDGLSYDDAINMKSELFRSFKKYNEKCLINAKDCKDNSSPLKIKNKWFVYMHVVPKGLSGYDFDKYYIGITSKRRPEQRWKNGKGYRENTVFHKAIAKYGWDNIDHLVLYEGLTEQEAKQKEIELIDKYKSNDHIHGYNICAGGNGSLGRKPSKETAEKISKSNKEYYKNNPDKITYNPVLQFDLSGNFIAEHRNIATAGRNTGISNRSVSRTANGEMHQTHGFVFKFKKDITSLDDAKIEIQKEIAYGGRKIPVIRLSPDSEFICEYKSMHQATKDGLDAKSIKKAVENNTLYNNSYWIRKEVV